jgi:hypothetical protein
MTHIEDGYFILGTTEQGSKFRPSDWVDRIATAYGSFYKHRIQYHPMIRPAIVEGQRSLFVAAELEQQDISAYTFLMDFANHNRLQVITNMVGELYSSAA